MNNDQIINAITVLRDVLKAAGLAYEKADEMIIELKENPVFPKEEIERAFCGGFLANMKSMADFDGNAILKKFENYEKQFGYYSLPKSFNKKTNTN